MLSPIQFFTDLVNQARFDADLRVMSTTWRESDAYKAALSDANATLERFYSMTRKSNNTVRLAAIQGGL